MSDRLETTVPQQSQLPPAVMKAVAWSRSFLLIALAVTVVALAVVQLRVVVIPLLVALLLSSLLVPLSAWLQRHSWPKWLAVTLSEVGVIALTGGLVVLVVSQLRTGFPAAQAALIRQLDTFSVWLHRPPLSFTDADLASVLDGAIGWLNQNSSALVSGALNAGSMLGTALAGLLLVLFSTLFFLLDGRRIFDWVIGLFPLRARPDVSGAGLAGWRALTSFARIQVLVAVIDAAGIGLGAAIIGAFFGGFPFLVPIVVAVFLGSFVPVVGAVVSGVVAVAVALLFLGPLPALLMLAVVLLVQQLEGHVLQPLVMGSAVQVHPLAVVLSVVAGGYLAGIPGTLFAVPLVAVVSAIARHLLRAKTGTDQQGPGDAERFDEVEGPRESTRAADLVLPHRG